MIRQAKNSPLPGSGDLCQYIIPFRSNAPGSGNFRVLVAAEELAKQVLNQPIGYSLDPDIAAVLTQLWYCLHLPRTRFDFEDLGCKTMLGMQGLELGHQIDLVPAHALQLAGPALTRGAPTLIVFPDDLAAEAADLSDRCTSPVRTRARSDLNLESLQSDWDWLARHFSPRSNLSPQIRSLISDEGIRSVAVPMIWMLRQFHSGREPSKLRELNSLQSALRLAIDLQVHLQTLVEFENEGAKSIDGDLFSERRSRIWEEFRCPVTICAPGSSPRSINREVDRSLRSAHVDAEARHSGELSALRFAVAHRALSRSGIAVEVAQIPDKAFIALDHLEAMWGSRSPTPSKVWKALDKVNKAGGEVLGQEDWFAIAHASSATVFSEFPIGLLRHSADSAPICCRVPIAYRPIVPLTRTIQFELSSPPLLYFKERLRVLVAECLSPDDPVGELSRSGWNVSVEDLDPSGPLKVVIREISNLDELREAIGGADYDALVISAHGGADQRSNLAGFVCGDELIVDQDLGHVPPLVILSACQVWPRGRGVISVADLLHRQGALAVIGTLVPVDVRRNATLMVRCFSYLIEAMSGRMPFRTFSDVWHHTTTSNAIHDIISGNPRLEQWAHQGGPRDHPMWEFKMIRSPGRLRSGHAYRDSEALLVEIAEERGIGRECRAWLRSPGYVPETLFYAVLGWPDRIVLNDPITERAVRKMTAQGQSQ